MCLKIRDAKNAGRGQALISDGLSFPHACQTAPTTCIQGAGQWLLVQAITLSQDFHMGTQYKIQNLCVLFANAEVQNNYFSVVYTQSFEPKYYLFCICHIYSFGCIC